MTLLKAERLKNQLFQELMITCFLEVKDVGICILVSLIEIYKAMNIFLDVFI